MKLANAENAFKKWIKILVCASPFLIALSGQAQTNFIWTNSSGSLFGIVANWTPNGVMGMTFTSANFP
jgi:hypothetical protein